MVKRLILGLQNQYTTEISILQKKGPPNYGKTHSNNFYSWNPTTPGVLENTSIEELLLVPKGLHRLIDYTEKFHLASLGAQLCEEDPVLFDKNFFYLFGWSGHLSVTERRKAAGELASLLSEVMYLYSSKGIEVSLRIITPSHGGNLALHMAEITSDLSFTIDELMLLTCPVKKVTAKYSIHPLFGAVYSVRPHLFKKKNTPIDTTKKKINSLTGLFAKSEKTAAYAAPIENERKRKKNIPGELNSRRPQPT